MLSDLIAQNVPMGVILIQDGEICHINKWALEFTGYCDEDVKNRSFLDLVHPEDQEKLIQRYDEMMNGEDDQRDGCYRILGKMGQIYWIMFKSRIVEYKNRPALLSILIDETKSKASEDSLKKSEERYRQLVDNLAEGIVVLNKDGICFINKMIKDQLGLDLKEIKKIPFLNFIHPEDQSKLIKRHQQRANGHPVPESYEARLLKPDGTQVLCEIRSAVISWEGEDAIQAAILDISQKKKDEAVKEQMEKKLVQMEKMEALGLLAGGVAHDLNNVLSGVVSYPELLLMDLPYGHPFIKPLDLIHSSGQKAAAIVNDLLALARRGVMTTTVLNLNTIIENYLKSAEHQRLAASSPNIKIDHSLDPELFNIQGADIHLQKTVMNLVTNAMEAQPDGGQISIKTQNQYIDKSNSEDVSIKEGEYTVLIVEDDGVGINSQDLGRIFEPFYTKKIMGRSGTGLGMAVVWGTVQDHSGYIDVQSIENQGSKFTLYFPVLRQKITDLVMAIPIDDYMGNKETILVVDDVKEQRQIAKNILDRLNYTTITASSGEEAVEYLKNNSCELLILDMIMEPGVDGFETYERVLKSNPEQKAVIVSGFSDNVQVKKVQQLGAGCYIKKPYSIEQIGMVIKQELLK